MKTTGTMIKVITQSKTTKRTFEYEVYQSEDGKVFTARMIRCGDRVLGIDESIWGEPADDKMGAVRNAWNEFSKPKLEANSKRKEYIRSGGYGCR